MSYSEGFIQETIKVWQPYSEEKLTEADAIEIAENMANLSMFLMQLEPQDGQAKGS